MRRLLPILLCLLAPAIAAGTTPPSAGVEAAESSELLDQVVATLSPGGGRGMRTLLTRSDLEWEARVLLVGRGAIGAAEGVLPQDTLAAVLDWLIAEHLLLAEAEQLEVAAADPAALEHEIIAFRSRLEGAGGWEAFLLRHEVSEGDIARIFRRRVVVDAYVASRLRLGMTISEKDVKRAFDARRVEFEGSTYEWVRPRLRAQLEREKREALVAALVGDLRRRAEVRVLVNLGGERRAAPATQQQPPWYLPAAPPAN